MAAILAFLEDVIVLSPARWRQLEAEIAREEEVEMLQVMSRAERKVWQEGHLEGREEGREEERLNLVLELLRHRCGTIEPAAEAQIRALPAEGVQSLFAAALDFTEYADLERWLKSEGVPER